MNTELVSYIAFYANGKIAQIGTIQPASLPDLAAALAPDGINVSELPAALDITISDWYYDTGTEALVAIPPSPALPNGDWDGANVPQWIPDPDDPENWIQGYIGPWYSFDFDTKEWVFDEDLAWNEIYEIQNEELKNTDKYMLADSRNWNIPGFEEMWETYRTKIRAVTSADDPLTLVWPPAPTN